MSTIKVLNMAGAEVGTVELNDSIFGIEPSIPAMHLCVVAYLANQRQGTQSTLTRSEVSGGGKKPWRQKGTGRARQGSTRAPQWYHGGISHGPKPRDYKKDVNKKVDAALKKVPKKNRALVKKAAPIALGAVALLAVVAAVAAKKKSKKK